MQKLSRTLLRQTRWAGPCRLRPIQKKRMPQTTPPARLLAQETIEVLDGACEPRPRVVTRHDIEHDVTALLQRGLTTTSAGGFFFIPYLLQLGAYDLAAALGPAKHEGIPKERLALGLVFESIFGYTAGIRAVDTVSRADFGLLAGLPFLPSPSTQYRFLQDVPVKSALDFQTVLGRRLVALAQVTPGHPVNIDGHNVKTYSRKAMKHAFITQEGRYGKAIRTFYTQDQASKKPLIALAAYSGTTVSQVTQRLAGLTRDILGRDLVLSQSSIFGQNPKIGYQKFYDLQTAKVSKKQLCDRTVNRAHWRAG